MTTQLNIRLPDVVIAEINDLAEDYGSQAKVIIAAVSKLKEEKEILKMSRKFYAAYNGYGTSFTYDSDGWSVHVFRSKAERDAWIDADKYPNGNPTREPIDLVTAKKIQPNREYWIDN
jgi:hypothetical protein